METRRMDGITGVRALLCAALAVGCGTSGGSTGADATPDVATVDAMEVGVDAAGDDRGATPDVASGDAASGDVASGDVASGDVALTPTARCEAVRASIRAAGFDDRVSVRCDDRYAYIVSDTYPAHTKMDGITGTNDQVPVPAPGYASPVVLAPSRASQRTMIDAALGIAVNGVPIYDYTSQGMLDPSVYDPRFDTTRIGELDVCNGHSGRGDDYHYHASPVCMIAAMRNRGASAILGWAFDGYPIYGNDNPDGTPIARGALDVCNSQPDPTFGFRYHTSVAAPYILQCLVGNFDLAMAPRVPPLSRLGGGGGRPPGEKPPGGVTDLHYVEAPDGTHTMTYRHQGHDYSIAYRPATTANCWDFEDTSYTTRGVTQRGTYCRGMAR